MHNDYVNSGELKNTGDPKYTKWLTLKTIKEYWDPCLVGGWVDVVRGIDNKET